MNYQSVIQDWVCKLGLRYQGVLVSAVRGCDTAPRDDASKLLVRVYRGEILNSTAEEGKQPKSYISYATTEELAKLMQDYVRNWDHYPFHYNTHFVHAAQILGYYHHDERRKRMWHAFYLTCCKKMHVLPETRDQLAARLEAPEEEFGKLQQAEASIDAVRLQIKMEENKEKKVVKEMQAEPPAWRGGGYSGS